MSASDQVLADFLRIQFGLAPDEPNNRQLEGIVDEIAQQRQSRGRDLDLAEIGEVVRRHCPSYGRWKYGAEVSLSLRLALNELAESKNPKKK